MTHDICIREEEPTSATDKVPQEENNTNVVIQELYLLLHYMFSEQWFS